MTDDVLTGISATALWTLNNRASEANRPDGVLRDPWAVRLRDQISYDYSKFGKANQSHALRARAFDAATADYLTTHPNAAVVALAEGLQTSFWRLDGAGDLGGARWYSVDLGPVIELRKQLLPGDDRVVELTQSALDRSWMDRVEPSDGVFITAEGLLMYLQPDQAWELIDDCSRRFPGGRMMFDAIPAWLSRRTIKGWKLSPHYVAPPMPFGRGIDEILTTAESMPGVHEAVSIALPPGRGLFKWTGRPAWDRLGWWRRNRPSITLLHFA